jgi:3-oxoadipate enol-lactonase
VTGAVRVFHTTDGPHDAPALVLSSSLGTTHEMWEPQVRALARRFRVIRYDMRGHGRSPVPDGPYEIGDLGRDVLAMLDHLDVAVADFCGLSIGGMIGMWLAAHAPARIGRLVLCCTSARFAPSEAWLDRAATVREHGAAAVADTVVARWFTPAFAAERPDVVLRLRTMLASTPTEGYAACCELVAKSDLHPDLAAIRASTLVVAGAEDPAAPRAWAKELAAGIRGSRFELVHPAAHLANVERPEAVTKLVLGHLLATAPKEEP